MHLSIYPDQLFRSIMHDRLCAVAVVGEEVGRAGASVGDHIPGREGLDARAQGSWRAGTLEDQKVRGEAGDVWASHGSSADAAGGGVGA